MAELWVTLGSKNSRDINLVAAAAIFSPKKARRRKFKLCTWGNTFWYQISPTIAKARKDKEIFLPHSGTKGVELLPWWALSNSHNLWEICVGIFTTNGNNWSERNDMSVFTTAPSLIVQRTHSHLRESSECGVAGQFWPHVMVFYVMVWYGGPSRLPWYGTVWYGRPCWPANPSNMGGQHVSYTRPALCIQHNQRGNEEEGSFQKKLKSARTNFCHFAWWDRTYIGQIWLKIF